MDASMTYIDISPLISARIAVFPGDQKYQRKVALDMNKGDHLTLSSIEMSLHVGAHADAPNHYHKLGRGIDQRVLDYYIGPAQVITVQIPRGQRIAIQNIQQISIQAPRILFRTLSFPDPNMWNSDFNSLSPELIEYLAAKGVRLVGIDTPSIDPEDSHELESHQAIFKNNLAILEGLVLQHVPDGLYQLIALPLKLEGADASPVRAILVKDPTLAQRT